MYNYGRNRNIYSRDNSIQCIIDNADDYYNSAFDRLYATDDGIFNAKCEKDAYTLSIQLL